MREPRFCAQCGKPLERKKTDDRERLACPDATCGHIHYENPTPVVAAIVEQGSDVILVRNKGWPEKWYGLLTGFLERGEAPAAAILREVKEELGVEAELVREVGAYGFEQMNQVIIGYHVRLKPDATPAPSEELEDIKRVPIAKLRPWPFGTGEVVSEWLKSRQGTE